MRLFIGVELPNDVKAGAAAVIEELRGGLRRVAPGAEIRWVDEANLHLTLWFLGEVGDALLTTLSMALREPFVTPSFNVRFEGLGAFPPTGSPRVFWAGAETGGPQLAALHAEVQNRMVRLAFEPEDRPYSPHLTLARVKEIRRADGLAAKQILATFPAAFGDFPVNAVTLFRSRLSPKGARYESVLRVPLR
jgi:2'-5' RNA ligase